jgi:hypothetical protein
MSFASTPFIRKGLYMKKNMTMVLAAVTLVVGVPFAFADGILNDAPKTREMGGVGNYTTDAMKNKSTADNADTQDTQVQDTQAADTRPAEPVAATESDTVDLGASSSGRAH